LFIKNLNEKGPAFETVYSENNPENNKVYKKKPYYKKDENEVRYNKEEVEEEVGFKKDEDSFEIFEKGVKKHKAKAGKQLTVKEITTHNKKRQIYEEEKRINTKQNKPKKDFTRKTKEEELKTNKDNEDKEVKVEVETKTETKPVTKLTAVVVSQKPKNAKKLGDLF